MLYRIIDTTKHLKVLASGVVNAVVHGILPKMAVTDGKISVTRLPKLNCSPFSPEFAEFLGEVSTTLRNLERNGELPLPFKFSATEDKENPLVSVKPDSRLGRYLTSLSEEQKELLWGNMASICQYTNQPYSRLAVDVPVRTFDEGSVSLELKSFRDQLVKKMDSAKVDEFFASLEESVSVPFGDGQIYASPSSPIWDLAPEVEHGKPRSMVSAMKVIGWLIGNPLVDMKGVLVKLSKVEWEKKCLAAGIDDSFEGLLVNRHAIKNKCKFALADGQLTFHIGYHNDSRNVEGKSQIFGNQAYRRSPNLKDRMRYTNEVRAYMKHVSDAIVAGDIKALVSSLSGVAKVLEGTPYHGNILQLLSKGLPVSFVNDFTRVVKNMIAKRIGRPKVRRSLRTLPRCVDNLGILEIALTSDQARKIGVRVGDTVVVIRSPKAEGFPALTMKVTHTGAQACSINPILYALFNQGDFDGDTIAVYKNEGLVEMDHSLMAILQVLFERTDEAFASRLTSAFNAACDTTWEMSSSELAELHPACGPLYQMLRAKAATGAYDNFATRLAKAGASNAHLRVFWNTITQVTITNMKHVGDPIADPQMLVTELSKVGIRLGVLDDVHYLLNGNIEGMNDAISRGRVSSNPIARSLVQAYQFLPVNRLVEANKEYANKFAVSAVKEFRALVSTSSTAGKILVMKDGVPQKSSKGNFLLLQEPFMNILNPKDKATRGTFRERFDKLTTAVAALGDASVQLDAWVILYCIAIMEPFKRWLLTNVTDESVDLAVCSLVERIGREAGFGDTVNVEELDE